MNYYGRFSTDSSDLKDINCVPEIFQPITKCFLLSPRETIDLTIVTETHLLEIAQGVIYRSKKFGSEHNNITKISYYNGDSGWFYILQSEDSLFFLDGETLLFQKTYTDVGSVRIGDFLGIQKTLVFIDNRFGDEPVLTDGCTEFDLKQEWPPKSPPSGIANALEDRIQNARSLLEAGNQELENARSLARDALGMIMQKADPSSATSEDELFGHADGRPALHPLRLPPDKICVRKTRNFIVITTQIHIISTDISNIQVDIARIKNVEFSSSLVQLRRLPDGRLRPNPLAPTERLSESSNIYGVIVLPLSQLFQTMKRNRKLFASKSVLPDHNDALGCKENDDDEGENPQQISFSIFATCNKGISPSHCININLTSIINGSYDVKLTKQNVTSKLTAADSDENSIKFTNNGIVDVKNVSVDTTCSKSPANEKRPVSKCLTNGSADPSSTTNEKAGVKMSANGVCETKSTKHYDGHGAVVDLLSLIYGGGLGLLREAVHLKTELGRLPPWDDALISQLNCLKFDVCSGFLLSCCGVMLVPASAASRNPSQECAIDLYLTSASWANSMEDAYTCLALAVNALRSVCPCDTVIVMHNEPR